MSMLAADGKRYTYPEWDSDRDDMPEGALLYLCDSRGVYIPRDFALGTKHECVANVGDDTWAILEHGPEHEHYWDAWAAVCDRATVRDPQTGTVYAVYQDGDCWLIPLEVLP
jgi:hypothetical protein